MQLSSLLYFILIIYLREQESNGNNIIDYLKPSIPDQLYSFIPTSPKMAPEHLLFIIIHILSLFFLTNLFKIGPFAFYLPTIVWMLQVFLP